MRIEFITKKFIKNGERLRSDRRNVALHCALPNLSKDPEIKVFKFDKGRGVVLLDSSDYYSKLDDIVHEIDVNSKVHPVTAKENSITYYIRKYLKNLETETL